MVTRVTQTGALNMIRPTIVVANGDFAVVHEALLKGDFVVKRRLFAGRGTVVFA